MMPTTREAWSWLTMTSLTDRRRRRVWRSHRLQTPHARRSCPPSGFAFSALEPYNTYTHLTVSPIVKHCSICVDRLTHATININNYQHQSHCAESPKAITHCCADDQKRTKDLHKLHRLQYKSGRLHNQALTAGRKWFNIAKEQHQIPTIVNCCSADFPPSDHTQHSNKLTF